MVRLMVCRSGSVRAYPYRSERHWESIDFPSFFEKITATGIGSKDCLRQTSFKPPRGEPLWKKETAVLLYTLGLSMNAIAKQLGVSTPSILNWIRAHAATHAPRPQPDPGESVVVMELDELWHFLQKKEQAVDLAGF